MHLPAHMLHVFVVVSMLMDVARITRPLCPHVRGSGWARFSKNLCPARCRPIVCCSLLRPCNSLLQSTSGHSTVFQSADSLGQKLILPR